MSVLILPGRGARGQPPAQPTRLNSNSALAEGLVFAVPLWNGVSRDLVAGLTPSAINIGGTRGIPAVGLAPSITSNGQGFGYGTSSRFDITGQITFGAWIRYIGVGGTYQSILQKGYLAAENIEPYTVRLDSSGTQISTGSFGGSGGGFSISYTAVAGEIYRILARYNGSWSIAVNGRVLGTSGPIGDLPVSTQPLAVGAAYINGSLDRYVNGEVWHACIWRRALSDAEIRADYAQPWDLYWVPGRVLYFDTAAAPAATSRPIFRQPARAFRRSF